MTGGELAPDLLREVVPVPEGDGTVLLLDEDVGLVVRSGATTTTATATAIRSCTRTQATHPPMRWQARALWSSFSSRDTFQAAMSHTVRSKPRSQSPTISRRVARMVSSLSPCVFWCAIVWDRSLVSHQATAIYPSHKTKKNTPDQNPLPPTRR